MSKPVDIFAPASPEEEARADAEAEQAIREGRVVPHSEVRKWLDDLAAGIRRPRPQPWK
ncbi:MAG TPA: hypothetical protein VEB20_02350 [Azospirillaceae bacterium]|nr:hypothetical protein [Azospirillaceae bacterium]